MGCHRLTYHFTAEPRLRCVYNAADGDRNRVACPSALGAAVETNSYDAWGRLCKTYKKNMTDLKIIFVIHHL